MILKTPKNQQKISYQKKKIVIINHKIKIFIMTLEGRQMIQENRLCKLINRIFLRIYFNTEISIGETKVTKSCKVNTPVNTNHFPQNLKKRYRFSLAIVVPQSGSNSHSGDRLFEWPKLSNRARRKVSKL